MTRKRGTILDLCVRQAGGKLSDVPRAARVCEFIVAWAIASRAAGGPIAIEAKGGFLDYWANGFDRRTAYRRLAEFRELFPEHDTPQAIADRLPRDTEPGVLTPVAVG